ncbi:MAG: DUF3810 domain-containing protein [Sphingobacteriales bacterium]|nr:MAG: DUF3810 domain-containing protein [Sphingobacteriales bacterium]
MRYKKKLIVLFVLLAIVTVIQYTLPYYPALVSSYEKYVFHPFQSSRTVLFKLIPFSVGDVLYTAGAIYLVYIVGKWVYFLFNFRTHLGKLGHSVLHTIMFICGCYILFFLGWGGNYYKPSLVTFWDINTTVYEQDTSLETFDRFLVNRLNAYAPYYETASFNEIDKKAKEYYKTYTNSRTKNHGLDAKPSIFGSAMQYFGIQGYYNPFTGEAQVHKQLPAFMLPFVVCHEMAHQSGIAAEDDANLLAYTLGVKAKDALFNYSAYLNLWLYTNARLSMIDTGKARGFRRMLNPLTISHLDTLKKIRNRFKSEVSVYSGHLYDGYLRLHHQKDGIESYNKVAVSAWAWELDPRKKEQLIAVP